MTVPAFEPRSRLKRAKKKNNKVGNATVVLAVMAGAAMAGVVFFLASALAFSGAQELPAGDVDVPSSAATAEDVETIRLRSGLEMPAVGYGTCCRPTAKGEEIYESTKYFLKSGGRLIDTAMAYRNHKEIGRAVKESGVPRSKIWITSKVAPGRVKSYDACLSAVDDILEELDTSYLDLLLIHAPKLGREPTVELWRCLIESRRRGKARSIGVSNFNRGEIEDIAEATGEWPEANEIQQHPWSSKGWRDLARWQKKKGIATIAYTSLGGSRFHRGGGDGPAWPVAVERIAERCGVTEAQVLLRWALQNGMAVIPGSGSREHIRENLAIPQFSLSEKDVSDIEGADAPGEWWDRRRGPVKYGDEEAARPWEKRENG